MKNLFRAIQLTFRYKFTIVSSITCALMVGLLWGGNIMVIAYPIVEICLKKENFVDWIEKKSDENTKKIADYQERITALKAESQSADTKRKEQIERQISFENVSLGWYEYYGKFFQWGKPYIERFAPRDSFLTLVVVIAFAMVGTILKAIFTILHAILSARIAQRTIFEIRNQMFNKIIRYEVNYFSQEGISNAMNRLLSDSANLSTGLTALYGKFLREPLKLFVCLGIAAYISWQLLVMTLLLVPLAVVSIRWLAKSIKRAARRGMEQGVKLFGRLEESIRSIRVVKAYVRERSEYGKFRRTNENLYRMGMKVAKYDALANPMVEIAGILMICVSVLIGSYLVLHDQTELWGIPMSQVPLSQEMLLVFFALLAGAADPARKLSDIFTQVQTSVVAADRVFEMIDREVPIVDAPDAIRIPRHEKSIVFEHVSFQYNKEGRDILRDVSLEIPFGETIGILGPSGCGKSTLLSLIPRFADACAGEVRIDDVPVQKAKMHSLRKSMGIITQEPILFDDTVANNIRYGKPLASHEEVVEAAKKAFAHDFITEELPEGYETIVGPGGGKLSGGQKQRIALARAFLIDPAIFLLDEATSQIDLYSEQMIHKALAKFIGNRTTVIVTHRLSALALANRIVVMQDGCIESIGTHTELLASSPFYQRLHQIEQTEE